MNTLSSTMTLSLHSLLVVAQRECAPRLKRYSRLPQDPMVLSMDAVPLVGQTMHEQRIFDKANSVAKSTWPR